jgi:hypothetical protein
MEHSRFLRVLGQSLEAARLTVFDLNTDGKNILLQSDLLTQTSKWILLQGLNRDKTWEENNTWEENVRRLANNQSIRFTPEDISLLDEKGRRQRRVGSVPDAHAYKKLSQLLRALGDHLDRIQAISFRISWRPGSISLLSECANGDCESRTFTTEKLEQLGSHFRFRRSSTTRTRF